MRVHEESPSGLEQDTVLVLVAGVHLVFISQHADLGWVAFGSLVRLITVVAFLGHQFQVINSRIDIKLHVCLMSSL